MDHFAFVSSVPNTLGIELELQLVDPDTFDLKPAAQDVLEHLSGDPLSAQIKPEITRSMIELNSSVHHHPADLLDEMCAMRDVLCRAAQAVGARVAGGGTHPFMRWQDRKIFAAPRFEQMAGMYGYLARQFTVFGQHIHLGVASGDEAIALTRRLMPYVPHLIAMSASSPYSDGVDTRFSCSRQHAINAFPLSGHLPAHITDWYAFESHLVRLRLSGLMDSQKDLYWDIRPKPEFGTVEIRVCDTPLTIERACQLAAFVQALGVWAMDCAPPDDLVWLAYRSNHFQACRFGLQADYVDEGHGTVRLADHIDALFELLQPTARRLDTEEMLVALRDSLARQGNDARWLRTCHQDSGDLPAVVRRASRLFQGPARGGLR